MVAAYTLQNTKAEITCASCPSPVQLHLENLQLGTRAQATEEPGILKDIRVEFREVGVADQNSEVDDGREAGDSGEDVPRMRRDASLDGVGANEYAAWSSKESHRGTDGETKPVKEADGGDGGAPRRERRSLSQFSELGENGWTGVDAGAPEDRGSLLDGQRQGRSEYRWNRDEARGNNRPDDPKITSSTFALTGDSAHNHAVVYWSGQNSSVSNPAYFFFFFVPLQHSCCFWPLRTGSFVRGGRAERGTNSATHRAENRCCAVPLLTGALESTDAHRGALFSKCQICAATVNCIRPRPTGSASQLRTKVLSVRATPDLFSHIHT